MFESLKRLYNTGLLDKAGLARAVTMKPIAWITPEQYEEIAGEPHNAN